MKADESPYHKVECKKFNETMSDGSEKHDFIHLVKLVDITCSYKPMSLLSSFFDLIDDAIHGL